MGKNTSVCLVDLFSGCSIYLILFSCLCLLEIQKCDTIAAIFNTSNKNVTDRLALLAFKNSIIQDPKGIFNSWNESTYHCDWPGVSCSHRHVGRVTSLNLWNQQLVGMLPSHIGNLSFMRHVHLGSNRFRGHIPQEIGKLNRLEMLNLSFNEFQGEIPINLSSCTSLRGLFLFSNHLVGKIPDELRYLVENKLEVLAINKNNLTGEIPRWLGNGSSLERIALGANNMYGQIPAELGQIPKLILLQVSMNNISGTIPQALYNLSSLVYLDIGVNNLHGKIMPEIGTALPNLRGLYLNINQFSGSIPPSLPNATALQILAFSYNNFSGSIPPNIGLMRNLVRAHFAANQLESVGAKGMSFIANFANLTYLSYLDIWANNFQGELPSSIGNLTTLTALVMGKNKISGSIPLEIERLTGLSLLAMENNFITGEIPRGIGKLQNLVVVDLSGNRLVGEIPPSLGNLSLLITLYIEENSLEGNIHFGLGCLQQLRSLSVAANKLNGTIPKEMISPSSAFSELNLSKNSFIGPLPVEVGNMGNIISLDVSDNHLSGEVPNTLSNCLMLNTLQMQGNAFRGRIPLSLSHLSSLRLLDLSRNNLSGPIPIYFENFTLLENLNLSFNNLEGPVPLKGIFGVPKHVSVIGNTKLCGGIKELGLPVCLIQKLKKHKRSLLLKVVVPASIAGLLGLVTCSVAILYWILEKQRRKPSTMFSSVDPFRKVSYEELQQATKGFSRANLIGAGSYGSVYKGMLDGTQLVAVKVLNLEQRGAFKSFMAECEALRNVRHRNLVKIITVCSSIDSRGADFKALVFEIMQNGSLEDWLHPSVDQQDSRKLNLTQRMNIVTDVASAIDYLHHHCEMSIIHGDLKPSNILLDDEMVAHVGDFGLARFLPRSMQGDASKNPTSSTIIKGTIGYVPPEYGISGKSSKPGDVYSFGILLLEIFVGKRPTDDIFKEGLTLHEYVKMALPERVMEIIDPSLKSGWLADIRCPTGAITINFEDWLVAILRIGIGCSTKFPDERMVMKDVFTELCALKVKISHHQAKS